MPPYAAAPRRPASTATAMAAAVSNSLKMRGFITFPSQGFIVYKLGERPRYEITEAS